MLCMFYHNKKKYMKEEASGIHVVTQNLNTHFVCGIKPGSLLLIILACFILSPDGTIKRGL